MESNDKPPYRHWHTVCAACGKVTLARPCKVPGEIEPVEHNPVIKCQHCDESLLETPLTRRGNAMTPRRIS
jgi:hypothetical protein